jgi:hypothetical protein
MKAKNLPRLWCALQGLLPLEACLVAQRAELAWPPEASDSPAASSDLRAPARTRNRIAGKRATVNVRRRGSL